MQIDDVPTIEIRTFGQIPNQDKEKQVSYRYTGTLLEDKFISLVRADLGSTTDSLTGIVYPSPCTSNAIARGGPDSSHSGVAAATGSSKVVSSLDTRSLDAELVVFALCYMDDNNGGAATQDSGIRITLPQLTTLGYVADSQEHHVVDRERNMTSITRATHKLPQYANQKLNYYSSAAQPGLAAHLNFFSIVAIGGSVVNPCANPIVASGQMSASASGVMTPTTAAHTFVVSQATLLTDSSVLAVCYTTGLTLALTQLPQLL